MIYEALVSVPDKHVQHWITQYLGQIFLAKRLLALLLAQRFPYELLRSTIPDFQRPRCK